MAFAWTEPKAVTTKDGRRMFVRSFALGSGDPFWNYWKEPEKKAYMKSKGLSPKKGRDGWQVNHWIDHTDEMDQVNATTGRTRLEEMLEAQDAEMAERLGTGPAMRVNVPAGEPRLGGLNIKYG